MTHSSVAAALAGRAPDESTSPPIHDVPTLRPLHFAPPPPAPAFAVYSNTATLQNNLLAHSSQDNCSVFDQAGDTLNDLGNNLADDSSCGTIPDVLTGLEASGPGDR